MRRAAPTQTARRPPTTRRPRSPPPPTIDTLLPEGTGRQVGPYKLLQLIGEGGFGSVFMAEQTEPVKRRVALKVIKKGMDTRQVIARFEQERQALAMMDHPGIAKVLDAGETETGQPYFVMELVDGEPVTDHCDRHKLSIPARLELFVQICSAVQHAHTKGIIHRDLKPSNVLVSVVRRPGPGQGHRLRDRQGHRGQPDREDAVHRAPAADRDTGVHEPRAGRRLDGHRHAHGRLRAGSPALRAPDRQHALRFPPPALRRVRGDARASSARTIRRAPAAG